jgi:quercetin dioxygenase-like cupin family protein
VFYSELCGLCVFAGDIRVLVAALPRQVLCGEFIRFQGGLFMRVLKINDLQEKPMDTATPIAGWTGGPVSRTRQAVIGDGQSENFRCNVVNFRVGATTGWHVHDCDQILVVTAGKGKVATESEERDISVGDIVHIRAGEKHWHGATGETPMSHITVTTVGSTSKH